MTRRFRTGPRRIIFGTSPAFVSTKQHAIGIETYTGQQIADGAKQGVWARQNAQSGATPSNLPPASTNNNGVSGGAQSGNITNVSYKQVKPSGNFTQLQHNAFSISYPSSWQTAGDQNSTVTIAPQAGVSQGAIAYGVIVGGAQDQSASSLDQAMRDLIQNLQQSNPGMQVSGNPENIQVNGAQGRSVNFTSTSPVQQNGRALAERDWLVALPRPQGGLLYVVFIAPENEFSRLSRTYTKMLNSLRLK